MITLETERLVLRPYSLDDFPALHALLSDPVTMSAWPTPFTLDQTRAWLTRQLDAYAARGFGRLAVELKSDRTLIGDCGLMRAEVNGVLENDIGYIFQHTHWKNGYATEAARAVLRHGFDRLKLPRVVANMSATNAASTNVAEKIGLRFELEFLNTRNRNLPTLLYSETLK